MFTKREKKNSKPPNAGSPSRHQQEEEAKVSVTETWPFLYLALWLLGLLPVREGPSGRYQTTPTRLLASIAMLALLMVNFVMIVVELPKCSFDSLLTYWSKNFDVLRLIYVLVLTVMKKEAIGRVMSALGQSFKPTRTWKMTVGVLLYGSHVIGIIYMLSSLRSSWFSGHFLSSVLITQVTALFDVHVALLISRLTQTYAIVVAEVRAVCRRGQEVARPMAVAPRLEGLASPRPPFSSHWITQAEHVKDEVGEPDFCYSLTARCDHLLRLVDLFNQAFSLQLMNRCLSFLVYIIIIFYFILIVFNQIVVTAILIGYTLYESIRFGIICNCAHQLQKMHLALEESVWDLQNHYGATHVHRPHLDSLAARLRARPAHISAGGVGVLGRYAYVFCYNTSLTYCALLFQYRPFFHEVDFCSLFSVRSREPSDNITSLQTISTVASMQPSDNTTSL